MPFSLWIARTWLPAALVVGLLPSLTIASQDPEPRLEPMPGSQSAPGDKLPPLDPLPAPMPAQPGSRQAPAPAGRVVTIPAEPDDAPAPAVEEMPAPRRVIEVAPEEDDEVIEMVPEQRQVIVAQPAPVVVAAPVPGAVWIAGHFEKQPDSVVTIPGRWEKPLIGSPRYVVGRSVTRPGKIVWVEGHWAQRAIVAAPAVNVVARPVADPGVRVVRSQVVATPVQPVVVASPVVVSPAPAPAAIVPAQWKRGLLGNWKYVPGKTIY